MQYTNKELGEGAYGKVYEARHNGELIAVKCNLVDQKTNFMGSIRELDLLHKLYGHPHIVTTNLIYYKNPFAKHPKLKAKEMAKQKCDSIYFIFKKADSSLVNIIEKRSYTDLKPFMWQMLSGLEYMHHKQVIHQDIKPCNVLISGSIAQLCDFGISEPLGSNTSRYRNVVTSWYRPPELMSGSYMHSYNADVWSMGMVFVEMISKNPVLVEIGKDDDNSKILKAILKLVPFRNRKEFLGKLGSVYDSVNLKHPTFENLVNLNDIQKKNFNLTSGSYDQFLDLLIGMLDWNPITRFSCSQALEHPFFDSYRPKILELREKYNSTSEVNVVTLVSQQRVKISSYVLKFFDQNILYRAVFSSLHLFDRYIAYMQKHPELVGIYGLLEDPDEDLILKYHIFLYLFVKYFTVANEPPEFKRFSEKYSDCYAQIEVFERRLVRDICGGKIYVPTVLELCGKELERKEMRLLLVKYLEIGDLEEVDNEEFAGRLVEGG